MEISGKRRELTIYTQDEWQEVVKELLAFAEGKKKFLLSGEIGAGKTTLIKYLCASLGVKTAVTSPTFALINEYDAPQNKIYHMDLYRLNDLQEAIEIGIEDYLFGDDYCFIEWPELIFPMIQDEVVRIQIEIVPDSARKIILL